MKQEKIYRYDFESIGEVECALEEYFDYYNHHRMHQSFDGGFKYEVQHEHKEVAKWNKMATLTGIGVANELYTFDRRRKISY